MENANEISFDSINEWHTSLT